MELVQKIQNRHPDVFVFHIPNGGWRTIGEATRLKAAGLKKGVADLCILFPFGRTSKVAFIEVKRPDKNITASSLSEDQEYFRDLCRDFGIPWICVNSVDEALDFVERNK